MADAPLASLSKRLSALFGLRKVRIARIVPGDGRKHLVMFGAPTAELEHDVRKKQACPHDPQEAHGEELDVLDP